MEKLPIEKQEKGLLQKVFITHPILTVEPIVSLQKHLTEIQTFDPTPANELHLTLFNYGRLENLYRQISYKNNQLTPQAFMAYFSSVLQSAQQLEAKNIPLTADSLALFGDIEESVFVLKVHKSPVLLHTRRAILKEFYEFVANCGIDNVEAFMRHSEKLQYQTETTYNPHITLGHTFKPIQPPAIDVSQVRVEIGAPRLTQIPF